MKLLKNVLHFIINPILTLIIFPFAIIIIFVFKRARGLEAIWLLWTNPKKFKSIWNIYEINNEILEESSEKQSCYKEESSKKKTRKRPTRYI